MFVIDLKTTNPYVNLATEEYLLHHKTGDFFMLWQNEPCIVVGRNQNTLAEINHDYVTEHNIPVVRRLTGGGAVFHDLGNLNYTFIEADAKDKFGNYAVFSTPVIEVLHALDVPATVSGRNDLLVHDKKNLRQCSNHVSWSHDASRMYFVFCQRKPPYPCLKGKPLENSKQGYRIGTLPRDQHCRAFDRPPASRRFSSIVAGAGVVKRRQRVV